MGGSVSWMVGEMEGEGEGVKVEGVKAVVRR